jgi:hypothetical protein
VSAPRARRAASSSSTSTSPRTAADVFAELEGIGYDTGFSFESKHDPFLPLACPGDCGLDGTIAVNELVTAVGVSLGSNSLAVCVPADASGDGAVTVDELIRATRYMLDRCPGWPRRSPSSLCWRPRTRRRRPHRPARRGAVETRLPRRASASSSSTATGADVFARDADTPLAPASNMKVLTALAALATFGPAHQFTTTVSADRPLDAEGAVGTLAVRGGGDPALTSEVLWRLAADLQRRGLRRVRDGLLLDDTYFDNERWNPAWGSPSVRVSRPGGGADRQLRRFSVEVAPPARAGSPAAVSVDPPVPFFRLTSGVRVGGDTPISVDRDSDGDSERIRVGGSVRPGCAVAVQRSVTDPVRYAGAVLRMQLAALGIAVDGPDRVGPSPPDSASSSPSAASPRATSSRS